MVALSFTSQDPNYLSEEGPLTEEKLAWMTSLPPESLNASWIGPVDPCEIGVFRFELSIVAQGPISSCTVWVSADQRYRLLVNGTIVSEGPQRGDALHWFVDPVDIGEHLLEGQNVFEAIVWNYGPIAPMAQHTVRTGFMLASPDQPLWSTPGEWTIQKLRERDFAMMHSGVEEFYIDVGPGEIFDSTVAQAAEKVKPNHITSAEWRGTPGGGQPWVLIPRSIPAMFRCNAQSPVTRAGTIGVLRSGSRVRLSTHGNGMDRKMLSLPLNLEPGHPLLLDFESLQCAYLTLSAKADSRTELTITYDEALWEPTTNGKGNRNDIENKEPRGYQDRVVLGPASAEFQSLWWRTFRYVTIETSAPTQLERLSVVETGYPLNVESSFESDDPWVERLWDVSVRTLQRCMGETYFDCPYYEQLQYVGDTRIQAMIGRYLSSDRLLQHNATETVSWSFMENGLSYSRYPSRQAQVIPPFTLWWVLMLLDQSRYDKESVSADHIRLAVQAVQAFRRLQIESDEKSFWNFGDWVPGWRWGIPPGGARSSMHLATLALAESAVSELVQANGGVVAQTEDPLGAFGRERGLFRHRDDPAWRPSEHIEALVRILQSEAGRDPDPWPESALDAAQADRCTYYFSYYKHLAKRSADPMSDLEPWKAMLERGLTTFAENPEPTRSDCHAWSAHPILTFLQQIAGVTSGGPHWRKARIQPNPGSLSRFAARIAHPDGMLQVCYDEGRLTIESPVPFTLNWCGKSAEFEAGKVDV